MKNYTSLDGKDHRWDDLGEAVGTLVYHYRRSTGGTPHCPDHALNCDCDEEISSES